MMFKPLAALAILGGVSVPAVAQTAQSAPATNQVQPAQPQMVKKRICEDNDNPSTTIHRTCKTVMVPAQPSQSSKNNQSASSSDDSQPNTSAY
jgi:hypothetical protein